MGRRRSLRRMFHKVWYNHEKTPLVRFHTSSKTDFMQNLRSRIILELTHKETLILIRYLCMYICFALYKNIISKQIFVIILMNAQQQGGYLYIIRMLYPKFFPHSTSWFRMTSNEVVSSFGDIWPISRPTFH